MRAASLFGVLALAKVLALWGRDVPLSPSSAAAFFWQDALVALLFGLVRPARAAWPLYGAVVLYAAVNVAVARILGTPLTAPMLRAARGTLADSMAHYVTFLNLAGPGLVLGTAVLLPLLLRRLPPKAWTAGAAAGLVLVAAGPAAVARVDTRGRHRNPIVAVALSFLPRTAGVEREGEGRASPFEPGPAEDLSRFRGRAAGRNVVLIALESTGAAYLEALPNVTRLAGEAVSFESAYAVYPESIKGLLTVLCSTAPALDRPAEACAAAAGPSLAALLRDQGYRTALFHSGRFAYLGMESVVKDRGFETLEDAGDIGGVRESSFGVDETSAVRRILEWIDAGRGRFFVNYLPIAGHHPYGSSGGPFPLETEVGRYRNALHEGDRAFGDLIEGLRRRGLYEETLFVIYGDHGEAFGEHDGNTGHTLEIYEENVRVPFLIAAPGLAGVPVRAARTASLLDTAPTILDLLGLPIPPAHEGRTLLDGPPSMAFFFTDYSLALLGLRDGRWKFIHELESGRSRLFDLEADPGERRDLSASDPVRTAAYRERLRGWASSRRER